MSISQTTVGGPTLPPAARYQIPFWPTRVDCKGDVIRQALKEASSKKKQKDLETKLETNLRHQKKARNLIKELG